jgi:hypothetical protein
MPSRFYKNVISQSTPLPGFGNRQVIELPKPTTVVDIPSTTVVAAQPTTVVDESTAAFGADRPLWQAEANGSLFPHSRVRQIERAQDALTHSEECVYDILWGPKNSAKDESRLTEIGYTHIARQARITRRNAALIIDRLIEKGFVRLDRVADILHRTPSRYRVLGYKAALEELAGRDRHWVVRSGNGVLFVHPVTVVASPTTTVVAGQPTTVVAPTTVTVVAGQPTTVVAATTHLDSKKEPARQPSSSALANACRKHGIVLDAAAERIVLKRCKTYDQTAAEEEIAYFAEVKILQLRESRNIGNMVGLLITAVPEFFVEPAHELHRFREEKAQQRAKDRNMAQQILDDPASLEHDLAWAKELLST